MSTQGFGSEQGPGFFKSRAPGRKSRRGRKIWGHGDQFTFFFDVSVRKVTPDGEVSTAAGSGRASHADSQGTSAKYTDPRSITIDGNGDLFVADDKRILRIAAGATPPAFFHPVAASTHVARYQPGHPPGRRTTWNSRWEKK
jgi:hypothetical protein